MVWKHFIFTIKIFSQLLELPYNDYFEYYGPDFKLHIPPSNMTNHNTVEYLDKVKFVKIIFNLKNWGKFFAGRRFLSLFDKFHMLQEFKLEVFFLTFFGNIIIIIVLIAVGPDAMNLDDVEGAQMDEASPDERLPSILFLY